MPLDSIIVRGAREHNLKNIDVVIPRDKMVVITGISGGGKSSLAFDTIYAEGQRRYVESLSAYARQFLGLMEKPDVDYIEGLSPAISIDQKGISRNPRSTVGTVTEISDYLRLLFARVGHPHCPTCGREVAAQTVQQIVDSLLKLPVGTRFMVLAPMTRHKKGEHVGIFEELRKKGFVRVRVNAQVRELSEEIKLDKQKWHDIDAVVDRLEAGADPAEQRGRLTDSVETALKLGDGIVAVSVADSQKKATSKGSGQAGDLVFSEKFACVHCGTSIPEVEPRTFSFNTPYGACPACTGLGTRLEVDPALVIPNPNLSLDEGAIQPWARDPTGGTWSRRMLGSLSRSYGFSLAAPVKSLKPEHLELVLRGNKEKEDVVTLEYENRYGRKLEWDTTYEGVIPQLERRYKQTESDHVRSEIERYMVVTPCPTCKGQRLKPESRAVTIGDRGGARNIVQVTALSIAEAARWVDRLDGADAAGEGPLLSEREQFIARQVLQEIRARLRFLVDVGLSYLTLDRTASSLSGGEGERIRLATQIGSGLMGVLYVLDEPSIGLHPVDGHRLIATLKRLRDLGNTLIIVEHDEAIMRAADWIIDLGPGAGERGGHVVCTGPIERIIECPESVTGAYLSGRRSIPVPARRRRGNGKRLVIRGARGNNLKDIDVAIPLGALVVITGVSGSGKSTLINDILFKALAQRFYRAKDRPGVHRALEGTEHIDKVVDIDQSPIGRTPRSNPATYTGAFTPIRDLFASVPEARARGYKAGRFSFNVKGGRCEACAGDGYIQIEMQFLPDVTVPCEVCHGKRYNREALEIPFKGKTIAEVLDMTVDEALAFFGAFPALKNKLKTLAEVGLGYIRLGQPATTLSGGEAQRVKLATELSRRATGRTLYILDEPTTGLSFQDVHALLNVLHALVETGNTVILIEHHLDLIKNADWIIDLGPAGGDAGGYVVATGTPEQVARVEESYTGQYLRRMLDRTSDDGDGRAEPLALAAPAATKKRMRRG